MSKIGLLMVPRDATIVDLDVDPSTAREVARGVGVSVSVFSPPKHTPVTGDLFPRDPAITDVNQRQMGNCWFLSALAEILHLGGPLIIKSMMFDEGPAVVVRLYSNGVTPVYIRVQKSLIDVRGGSFHSVGGALWAPMLEKAMTAFRRDDEADSPGLIFDLGTASYTNLVGGFSYLAFEALLGVEAQVEPLDPALYHTDLYAAMSAACGNCSTGMTLSTSTPSSRSSGPCRTLRARTCSTRAGGVRGRRGSG